MLHCFANNGHYILLDVESGSVHDVDELIFDIVNIWQTKGQDSVMSELAGKYDKELLLEAVDELTSLSENGEFDTPVHSFVQFSGPPVIKAMCLHVAHDCNLRCKYCFAGKGEYSTGKALMPYGVGKRALDFLIENSGERTNLEVDFFGGEPLLNFDVVKQLVRYGRKLEKKHGKQIAFTLTTNCLAIDQDVIDFCKEEIHNVVISVDGRKDVHNSTRRTINDRDSYDLIMPKAKALGLSRQDQGLEYYVRGTFTRENLDFSNDVIALADEGFDQISIEPVVLDGGPLAIREEDLPKIFEEYDKLAQIIEQRDSEGKWFNFFHFMLDLENGPCLSKRMSGCGAGNEYVAISPQGDIYPCHQFVGQEKYCMGSVVTGDFNRSIQGKFRSCTIASKPDCSACWAKYYCSGGCAANAVKFNGRIDKPYKLACEMEKKRLETALGLYVAEWSRDRSDVV